MALREPECEYCDLSTLAALTRVSGTLSLAGSGRYRLTVATETGAVARTMIALTHRILKLKTEFTVRKSVLHKVRNYLITLPDQPDLDKALVLLGILDRRGGLVAGVPRHIVARPCCRLAYIRGALIAGGFVADPRGDFHLEIAVQGEEYAKGLCDLLEQIGVHARVNARRGSYAVYIKSAEEIKRLLQLIGAKRSVAEIEEARAVKLVKNDVNRRVNAELANQTRSAGAANISLRSSTSLIGAVCVKRCRTLWQSFVTYASVTPISRCEIWGKWPTLLCRSRPCITAFCALKSSLKQAGSLTQ